MAAPPRFTMPSKVVAAGLAAGRALTDRTKGSVPAPSSSLNAAELTTEIYSYIAKPSLNGKTPVLYNADRQYAQVIVQLETAGPVSVGTRENLLPVLGGNGILLETGQPFEFFLSKGNRLYIASTSVNRVKVIIQPLPWLEQITGILAQGGTP